MESLRYALIFKKDYLKARFFLFKMVGRDVPIYNQNLSKSPLSAYFHAIMLYFPIWLSSKQYQWKLLPIFIYFLKFAGYWYHKFGKIK